MKIKEITETVKEFSDGTNLTSPVPPCKHKKKLTDQEKLQNKIKSLK